MYGASALNTPLRMQVERKLDSGLPGDVEVQCLRSELIKTCKEFEMPDADAEANAETNCERGLEAEKLKDKEQSAGRKVVIRSMARHTRLQGLVRDKLVMPLTQAYTQYMSPELREEWTSSLELCKDVYVSKKFVGANSARKRREWYRCGTYFYVKLTFCWCNGKSREVCWRLLS